MDGEEDKSTTPKKPRKKRRVDPLKKKSKIGKINLDELNKPSKGTEMLNRLKEDDHKKKNIKKKEDSDEKSSEYKGTIKDGVEVVDVKNINPEKKNLK